MAVLSEVKKHYGRLKLFIDGEWVASGSRIIEESRNPYNEEIIAEFPRATFSFEQPNQILLE